MFLVRLIFSAYYWVYFTVTSVFLITLTVVTWALSAWWDPSRLWLHGVNWIWARTYLLGNPFWRLTIRGKERLDWSRPTLYVANHLSTFDIFVLFCLNSRFHWISKRSNTWIPALGLNMILCRTIFLDRESPKDILAMVKQSVKRLEEGISLLIFPEGERSLTGHLNPFLGGAFSIAKRARVPIQPIVITGTYQVLKRYSALLNPVGRMSVTVLDPIPAEQVDALSTEELSKLVHNRMAEALPPEHKPLPGGE